MKGNGAGRAFLLAAAALAALSSCTRYDTRDFIYYDAQETYTITYHNVPDWAENPNPPSQYNQYALTLKPLVLGPGYTFEAWYDNGEFAGLPVTEFPLGIHGNKNLWAKWSADTYAITYTIAYDGNGSTGGSAPASQTKTVGTPLTLQTAGGLTRTDYAFTGWNTRADGTGENYAAGGTLTTDLRTTPGTETLYARWTAETDAIINLTHPGLSTGSGFTYAGGVFSVMNGAEVTVMGTTTSSRITVTGAVTLNLVSAVIDLSAASGSASPLDLASGANCTLRLSGTSALTGTGGGAGIHAPEGATLIITSTAGDGQTSGTLTAKGGSYTAGIGGCNEESGGTITIAGGTVNAEGGAGGTGIGGGRDGSGGDITISGGTVNATGGDGGTGIGGGRYGSGGDITISGGTVNTEGGFDAAGIGGGGYGSGGTITISGGTVNAEGGYAGAGIGGGASMTPGDAAGTGGNITISGGTVNAAGGLYAAGIGGGQHQSGGTITITDGSVTAAATRSAAGSGSGGAGIGSGSGAAGSSGTITITGGTVNAEGADDGAGIGGGAYGVGGTVRINFPSGTSSGTAKSGNGPGIGPGNGGSGGSFNGGAFPTANPYEW